uniref:ENTH domain-containing protein n=1 Tax=Arcella intermedia TaxID=1963864 RepID=A0A6B2L008_9EUKA
MFSDISKLTFQGAKECERLRTQLLSKLKSTSPAVKIKVLMVLKYLLENGHPHFQTILQNKADEIRPCLDFKAPPDPLHGDAPSRLVRDKAALVMNALYETRTDASYEYNQPPSTQGNPVTNTQSFTPAPGPNFGKGISSIEGPRPITPAKKGVIETLKEKAEETFKNVSNKDPSPSPPVSKFKPLGGGPVNYPRGGVFTSHHISQSADAAFVDAPRDSGKPGGGWDTCEDNTQVHTGEEAELVNQFCSLKANNFVPTRPQITEFFSKVNGKDISMVTYYLALQLNNNDWKNRYRSLALIHELLQTPQYKPTVEEYFSVEENYAALTVLNSSVQKTIRDKLAQIISLLPTSVSQGIIPPAQATDSIEDGSLFGGLNISENSLLPPPQEETHSDESIFGGISITPEPTPVAVAAPTQNVSVPTPTPSVPAVQKPPNQVVPPSTQPSVIPAIDQNTTQFPFIQTTNQQPTQDTKQLLSDIFNPNQTQNQTQNQNKVNPVQMTSIQNPPGPSNAIPFGYPNTGVPMPMPPYNYPQQAYPPYGYPYYPAYPGAYPGVPIQSPYPPQPHPQAQQQQTTTPAGAFDFVASETVQKKDPFDFIKVGQI